MKSKRPDIRLWLSLISTVITVVGALANLPDLLTLWESLCDWIRAGTPLPPSTVTNRLLLLGVVFALSLAVLLSKRWLGAADHEESQGQHRRIPWLPLLFLLGFAGIAIHALRGAQPLWALAPLAAMVITVYVYFVLPKTTAELPPAEYGKLVGRHRELRRIRRCLRGQQDRPVAMITGLGGIGKTAIAYELARRYLRRRSYDHIVWSGAKLTKLRGEHVIATGRVGYDLAQLVDDIATQCHIEEATAQERLKREVVKSYLRQRRALIVLDNLDTVAEAAIDHADRAEVSRVLTSFAAQARELLGPRCALLITSRYKIEDTHYADIEIPGLLARDSLRLLRYEGNRLGVDNIRQAGRDQLLQVHKATGGAPLMLKMVVGMCASLPLQATVTALQDVSTTSASVEAYAFLFEQAVGLLTPEAWLLLRTMSLFDAETGATMEAMQTISGLEESLFGHSLRELLRLSLLQVMRGQSPEGRYTLHQLTHSFVSSRLPEKFRDVVARFTDYYAGWASSRGDLAPGDIQALDAEQGNLRNQIERVRDTGDWRQLERTLDHLWDYLRLQGHWQQAKEWAGYALDAARNLSDASSETKWSFRSGLAAEELGEADEAHQFFVAADNDDCPASTRGDVHLHLGWLAQQSSQDKETVRAHLIQSEEWYGQANDIIGRAKARRQLALLVAQRGDRQQALAELQNILTLVLIAHTSWVADRMRAAIHLDETRIHLELGQLDQAGQTIRAAEQAIHASPDRLLAGDILYYQGRLAEGRGELDKARASYLQRLELMHRDARPSALRSGTAWANSAVGDRSGQAAALIDLGNLSLRGKRRQRIDARRCYEQALRVVGQDDRYNRAVATQQLGFLDHLEDDTQRAEARLGQAREMFEGIGANLEVAGCDFHRARVAESQEQWQRAEELYHEALRICGYSPPGPLAMRCHYQLGRLAQREHFWDKAAGHHQQALDIAEQLGLPEADQLRKAQRGAARSATANLGRTRRKDREETQ